jgi:glycyl-tRNA synthetase
MAQPLNFQQVILKLHDFWSSQGCLIWEPYNVQVGAGTGNPATLLRVLGPEPWRVAYAEPSVRPDDGRFGENPNRMQKYYQYQVILKPDPGNPQEMYLQSLEALGINPREHDIRFVEDNWESPALGAWGLGWEVWLDGQEITQFTYFQQAGGIELKPVSVEITYGVERIVLALQNKESAWQIDWLPGVTYGDIMYNEEVEHCNYYFNIADPEALKEVYDTYEREMGRALEGDAVISAYDYVLKCSHLFNVLDTRGAIGVTERAIYFRRMRDMTRNVAKAYLEKRQALGFPMLKMLDKWTVPQMAVPLVTSSAKIDSTSDMLLEIGVEEMPASDVTDVQKHLETAAPALFEALRLAHAGVRVMVTPRRIVIHAQQVAARQPDEEQIVKGPPADRAFDANGNPTKAAEGFAKGKGIDVSALKIEEVDGGRYVTALVKLVGRPALDVLGEALPNFVAGIKFGKSMRWNDTDIAFSRPLRWLLALWGETVIPFEYAGVHSGSTTYGIRPYGSPDIAIQNQSEYFTQLRDQGVILDIADRRRVILEQITRLADEIRGVIPDDPALLDEVTNLVEAPTALRGTFEVRHLELPRDVLITVMRNKQRYFALEDQFGVLLPFFITVRNGDGEHLDKVIYGNEQVLKARFADASYFYQQDLKKPLPEYLSRLATLTFQEKLGSMLDKNERIARLVNPIGKLLDFDTTDVAIAQQAAHIAKADLATQMVVEMTALQGIMGREYALKGNYPEEVANAIFEHWLPRFAGDTIPRSEAGTLLALADKLDSLVGLFAAGLAPKATSDPYGLRRAMLGIIQILIRKGIDLDLPRAFRLALEVQPLPMDAATAQQLHNFAAGRLDAWLTEERQNTRRDIMRAVLAEKSDNPYRAYIAISELETWVNRDGWETILDNFARCVRITRSEKMTYTIVPAALVEPQEQDLYDAYLQVADTVAKDTSIETFLSAFAPIVPRIQAFFDHVLVNAEDQRLRENRLGLLQAISALQKGRADLSELSGF